MPPLTKAGGDAFRKEVEFVQKDDAEQRATGIVMVPDKADLQHDFAREETIRAFAEEFGALMDSGSADGGIMHAAWPSEWMSLERNEVLDESEDIGGTTAPEGAWVQTWEYNDDGVWSLVEDGVLGGYSIGAKGVEWDGPYEQDDDAIDDVDTSAVDDGTLVWELVDGITNEVSTVDIPAVPDAEILERKADTMKRLGDHLGDPDAFVDEAMERGHSEAEAERLWNNLNRALEEDGSSQPGKLSTLERIGKAALSAVFPGSGEQSPSKTAGDDDPPDDDEDDDDDQDDKHATGGDTPDDSTDMSDNPDGGDADKSLAEQNAEQISELTDAVKNLTEAVDDDSGADPDGDKTAEVELPSGEVVELSKAEAMSWFEDDDGTEKDVDGVAATKADIQALHARLDSISRQSAGSQQLDQGASESEDGDRLSDLGKALS